MQKVFFLAVFIIGVSITGCHKKNYPSKTAASNIESNKDENVVVKKSDSLIVTKAVVKKKKEPLPKVITVNDNAAHKSVDGRLYYDVMGHRYWKNYTDGKYYLFNKSMFNDPAFTAPK